MRKSTLIFADEEIIGIYYIFFSRYLFKINKPPSVSISLTLSLTLSVALFLSLTFPLALSLVLYLPDWLAKATATALSCKEEYDTLLADMRDPEIKAYFGADKISAAKETAKREWQDAER